MADDFVKMLERFAEYRKSLSMPQIEISEKIGMTQSRFSKSEVGNLSISNDMLKALYDCDWDIDYIVSGVRQNRKHKLLRNELIEFSEENEIFKLIYWALYNYCEAENILDLYGIELDILHELCLDTNKDMTVFYIVRKLMGIKQEEFAKSLNITIKRCRKFEKGKLYPDADLLRHVFIVTRCRPSLFLKMDTIKWDIIENVWSVIEEDKRRYIVNFINNGIMFYNSMQTK